MKIFILIMIFIFIIYPLKIKLDSKKTEETRYKIIEFLSSMEYFLKKDGIDLSDLSEYDAEMKTNDFFIIAIMGNYGREREKYYKINDYLLDKMLFAACSIKPAHLFKNNSNEWVFYSSLGKLCYMIIPSDSSYGIKIIKNVKEYHKIDLKEISQEEIEKFVGGSIDYRIPS